MARVLSDGGWLGTVFNSPCFRCSFVLNYATHYTILFDICQMLNEINRGYLPRKDTKGAKEILNHEGTKFFDRIYRMIGKGTKEKGGFATENTEGTERGFFATKFHEYFGGEQPSGHQRL